MDKDDTVYLEGPIIVNCQFEEIYNGVNTYQIGFTGTYFDTNGLSNYYVSKFNSKFNLTEFVIYSNDKTVMEQARAVYVDIPNEKVYVAVEVNKNKYHNRTVYKPGALPY